MSAIVSRRRRLTKTQARLELYATARMVDSTAAQLQMLSEDDCLIDEEQGELVFISQLARRLSVALFARAGHA